MGTPECVTFRTMWPPRVDYASLARPATGRPAGRCARSGAPRSLWRRAPAPSPRRKGRRPPVERAAVALLDSCPNGVQGLRLPYWLRASDRAGQRPAYRRGLPSCGVDRLSHQPQLDSDSSNRRSLRLRRIHVGRICRSRGTGFPLPRRRQPVPTTSGGGAQLGQMVARVGGRLGHHDACRHCRRCRRGSRQPRCRSNRRAVIADGAAAFRRS